MGRRPSPFPGVRTALAAALALALSLAGGWPSAADPGGGHGGDDHHPGPIGLPGVPATVIPGGNGSPGSSGDASHGHGGVTPPVGVSVVGPLAPVIAPPAPGSRGGHEVDDSDGRLGGRDSLAGALRKGEDRGRDSLRDMEHELSDDGRIGGRGDDHGHGDIVQAAAAALQQLTQARERQAEQLLTLHRDLIEPDNLGRPVVRGEVLAIAPTPAALARAGKAGFRVRSRDVLPELGLESVVLIAPPRTNAVTALRRLRALDPAGQYDFNHLYQEGGVVGGRTTLAAAVARAPQAPRPPRDAVRVGLVDGGVAANAPALSSAHVVQRGFAPGGPKPSAHGTAVASLIAGRQGIFRGAAPGAWLFVADVYGATPAGGSAEAIVRALAWLAQSGASVINVSLVGPPNLLLETAVKNLTARGHIVVAAVGNDGPAAAPLYPASYPGVIAVTGVDPRWRILPEAGRATHVDFAAPASNMAAAGLDGAFVSVRGTSFAAPIAAGLLAKLVQDPDPGSARRAVALLGRRALDVGPRGPDKLYGHGIVGSELRIPPGEVHARLALRGP